MLFRPDEIHRGHLEPAHPIRGEWYSEGDDPEVQVNLPGNGASRLLEVIFVAEGGYPNCYEWTRDSRAGWLGDSYVIKANPCKVKVEVMGTGDTPSIENTLVVDVREGMLVADWAQRSADESTNWVPRESRGAGFRAEPTSQPDSGMPSPDTTVLTRRVRSEIDANRYRVNRAIDLGRFWNVQVEGLERAEWDGARDSLAAQLPRDLLNAFDTAYVLVDAMNARANDHFHRHATQFDTGVDEELKRLRKKLKAAWDSLEDYYGGATP